jgi:DinB superfamily
MQDTDLIDRLSVSPARIAQATAGWSDTQLRAAPAGDEWSAGMILAHIRASDDILAYRAYMLLVRDGVPMPSFDERRWAEVAGYTKSDFRTSLEAFRLRRAELVGMLRRAHPDDWRRSGVHEERGSITLIDIITHVVEHEEEHCTQLEALRIV